jgi:hypothetical protein
MRAVFAKKDKAPSAMAETLRRLAEQGVEELRGAAARCAGPMGEAAFDAIAAAAQERHGLGFVPGASRLGAADERLLLERAFSAEALGGFGGFGAFEPFHEPQAQRRTEPRRAAAAASPQRERRTGGGMPFAADFSGAAERQRAARQADADAAAQRRAGERTARQGGGRRTSGAGPFGGWMPDDAPPPPRQHGDRDPEVARAYAKIGLAFGTPIEAVKQRRRDLAMQLHGDRHGRAADRQLGEINAAVDVIEGWLAGGG